MSTGLSRGLLWPRASRLFRTFFSSQSKPLPGGCNGALRERFIYSHSSVNGGMENSKFKMLTQKLYPFLGSKLRIATFSGLPMAASGLGCLFHNMIAAKAKSSIDGHATSSKKEEESHNKLFLLARKLWFPMLLFVTVIMGWNYPVTLVVNSLLLLISTKPSPNSIYLWLEQWKQQNQGDMNAWLKVSQLFHIEVLDYKFFCVAQARSINHSMVLIGILGEWWVLFSGSSSLHIPSFHKSDFPDLF